MFLKKPKIHRGFTLLETVVALGIFLMVIVAVMEFVHVIFTSQNIMYLELSAQKDARKALENFVKEARNASVSSIGSYLIADATATSFSFYSDIDSDTYREKIRYFVSGTNLNKGVIKPAGNPLTYNPSTEVVVTMVKDLTSGLQPFFYYDKNYNGKTAALSFPVNVLNINLVKVKLSIDQKTGRSPEPLLVETQVEIRNLKYAN